MQSIPGLGSPLKPTAFSSRTVWILAGVFFLMTSWMSWGNPLKFDSPDETITFYFLKRLADGVSLAVPQPLHDITNIVYPRNVSVLDTGQFVPASFLGMILLYGTLGFLIHNSIILFLTPLMSSLALVAFFRLVRKIFPRQVALLSTLLLALHPAFWYFSSRGMYHNTLFFDLLIIGLWALSSAITSVGDQRIVKLRRWWYLLAGLSLGLAIVVRASEAGWIGLMLVLLTFWLRKKIDFKVGFLIGLGALLLPLIVMFFLNNNLYGSVSSFGYEETASKATGSELTTFWARVRFLFFPFGVHLQSALINFWQYGVSLIWWLSLPLVLGLVQALRRTTIPVQRLYLALYLLMSIWLILTYGSWTFFDNPDPTKITLGTSYSRYWLPVYGFGLPYTVTALYWMNAGMTQVLRRQPVGNTSRSSSQSLFGIVYLGIVLYLSCSIVILNSEEGLASIQRHTLEYKRFAERVVQETPIDTVIISGKADKIFFPERSVIVSVDGVDRVSQVRKLLDQVPVYVYVSPVEAARLARRVWEDRGFAIGRDIVLSANSHLIQLQLPNST